MRIARRLFVVPLANNNHGKTTIITALLSQGLGRAFQKHQKRARELTSPWGRKVDAYVFCRSYQESEKCHAEASKTRSTRTIRVGVNVSF